MQKGEAATRLAASNIFLNAKRKRWQLRRMLTSGVSEFHVPHSRTRGKDLAIAEDHDFTQAWFNDSQMIYSDIYNCLAATR